MSQLSLLKISLLSFTCGLLFSTAANSTNLPNEIMELKPRCDKMMADIRDGKVEEIIKGYHPMMQEWQDGKRARKLIGLSIAGYKRKAEGIDLLNYIVFSEGSSGFMEIEDRIKNNYPSISRLAALTYKYEFINSTGNTSSGGTQCLFMEENGSWYFYDYLPF